MRNRSIDTARRTGRRAWRGRGSAVRGAYPHRRQARCRAPSDLPSDDSFGWTLQLDALSALTTIWRESLGGSVRSRPGLEIVIATTQRNALAPKPTLVVSNQNKRSETKRIKTKTNEPNSNTFRFPIKATEDVRPSAGIPFTAFSRNSATDCRRHLATCQDLDISDRS